MPNIKLAPASTETKDANGPLRAAEKGSLGGDDSYVLVVAALAAGCEPLSEEGSEWLVVDSETLPHADRKRAAASTNRGTALYIGRELGPAAKND